MSKHTTRRAAACLAACLLSSHAGAQTPQGAHISIELNALEAEGDACRISFVIQNGHAFEIGQAVYEAVLFGAEGQVDRLTLLDFGALPAARPRVRQFVIPDLACADLTRLLFNGAQTCAGDSVPQSACSEGLALRSRTDVEVIG